jgi:hypothetical protein
LKSSDDFEFDRGFTQIHADKIDEELRMLFSAPADIRSLSAFIRANPR